MVDSIKLIKLDCLSIKGHLKQMLLSYLMITVVLIGTVPYMLNMVYFVLASSFLIYPFMVEEQNNMSYFHKMIAITKKKRVQSKYLEAILAVGIMILMIIPMNMLMYHTLQEGMSYYLFAGMALIGVLFFCMIVGIQIPCCFKWGYAKSRFIGMIMPIIIGFGIPTVVLLLSKLMPKEEVFAMIDKMAVVLTEHTPEIMLVSLLIGAVSLSISYTISLKVAK
ncbi:MAG: ABC-2 transporter permease [Cellulosilyticaceae bacterium]